MKQVFEGMAEDFRELCGWVRARRGQVFLVCLYALFLMGPRLFYHDVGIDTGALFKNYAHYSDVWAGSGRFGLTFSKWLFHFSAMLPYAANLLMLLFLLAFVTAFSWLVWRWSGRPAGFRWFYPVFSILFLSSPVLTEQFYFTLQTTEFAWAMLLCLISVYLTEKLVCGRTVSASAAPENGKENRWCCVCVCGAAVALMIWAFGTYQAFFVFFIALAAIFYLLRCASAPDDGPVWYWLAAGVKLVALFLIGAAGWFVVNRLLCRFFFAEYPYASGMYLWKMAPATALTVLKFQLGQIYLKTTDSLYYSGWFTPVLLLTAALFLVPAVRGHRKKLPWLGLALFILFLSPGLLLLVSGGGSPIRSMIFYPLVFAFCFAWAAENFRWRGPRLLLLLALFSCCWSQTVTALQMQESGHLAYENDRLLLNRIITRMEETAGTRLEHIPVAFVGKIASDLPEIPMGEATGHSFLGWDAAYDAGVSGRIAELAYVMGVDMCVADEEQRKMAAEYSEQMPPWPADGCICMHDGVLIVKLSAPEKTGGSWWYAGGWHHWDDQSANYDILRSQWYEEDGVWYYFDSEGDMVVGDCDIGGQEYHFDLDGKWIEE